MRQLQGKALSYNNLLDTDAALRCLLDVEESACVIVKHHSLCGLAAGGSVLQAYERALACDPESAFGGIVGFNRAVDAAAAKQLAATFLEVILAPAVESSAQTLLAAKPALRVVTAAWPASRPEALEWRGDWAPCASCKEKSCPITTCLMSMLRCAACSTLRSLRA